MPLGSYLVNFGPFHLIFDLFEAFRSILPVETTLCLGPMKTLSQ